MSQFSHTINNRSTQRLRSSRRRIITNSRLDRQHKVRRVIKIRLRRKVRPNIGPLPINLSNRETASTHRRAINNNPTLIHKPITKRLKTNKPKINRETRNGIIWDRYRSWRRCWSFWS